ncbi:hypothetical protein NIES2104_66430 [Leptolyngbya sp. NIES-2104]|nr:hypothetical protein NIES2104_66430 [Leptolyngbya sp. NIES-2104]
MSIKDLRSRFNDRRIEDDELTFGFFRQSCSGDQFNNLDGKGLLPFERHLT